MNSDRGCLPSDAEMRMMSRMQYVYANPSAGENWDGRPSTLPNLCEVGYRHRHDAIERELDGRGTFEDDDSGRDLGPVHFSFADVENVEARPVVEEVDSFPPSAIDDLEEHRGKDGFECIVCLMSRKNRYALDCMHANVCIVCIREMKKGKTVVCPTCRKESTTAKRIYT